MDTKVNGLTRRGIKNPSLQLKRQTLCNFCRFSKKALVFFGVSAKFKTALMVFVAVCHTLDNDHVKGNFILFAMSIKVMAVLWGKTSQRYFDWTPAFAVLAKKH